MELNVLRIVRVVMCLVSTLCCILAMALPQWLITKSITTSAFNNKTSYTNTNTGLWKECSDTDGCTIVYSSTVMLLVSFMVTLGVILLIGTLSCAVLHVINAAVKDAVVNDAILVYMGGIMAAIAGVLQLIAFAAFVDYKKTLQDEKYSVYGLSSSYSFGASFGLDIVTCIISLVTAALFLVPQFLATSDS